MIRRPPRSTLSSSSAASDVYKRQAVMMDWHAKQEAGHGPSKNPTIKLIWSVREAALPSLLLDQCRDHEAAGGAIPSSWLELYHTGPTEHRAVTPMDPLNGIVPAEPGTEKVITDQMVQGRPEWSTSLHPDRFRGGSRLLVWVCGPAGMVQAVSQVALEYGYDLHSETFEL
eukprot:TRINITY_DN49291_c0_g1_i4.p1 TRINITY_DN49291_c0_g1~~TRINITY_DN49291_c0_g1_i4.p1  ORF type:complete len:171 (-),score=35.80 TRINITY_DN49291_c0_g1_i4:331-843(-)